MAKNDENVQTEQPRQARREQDSGLAAQTVYVSDSAPSLPDANVTTVRPDPVIDETLLALRDREAQANADRVKRP